MKTDPEPVKPAKAPVPPTRNLLVERLAGQRKRASVLHRILRRK